MNDSITGFVVHRGLETTIDDITRMIHLAAIAVAFGTVVFTDIMSFRRVSREVTKEYCLIVESAHAIIVPCLIAAWVTGVILLGLQTGFELSAFSPKLWAKLFVVTSLTATALAVKIWVMPAVKRNLGRTLMEAKLSDTILMAVCAGFSMAGWTSALILGGLTAAKTAPGWLIFSSILIIHLAVLSLALRSAVTVNSNVRMAVDLASRCRLRQS